MPNLLPWLTLLIVAATIVGIAVGRWPVLRVNRASLTVIGAALLLAVGALTLKQAYAAIDDGTLLLLFSMMVVNGYLSVAGFFNVIAQRVVQVAHSPRMLLALLIAAAGVLSALFLNDTVVLLLTPLVLDITLALKRDPIPYLLGLATAANVGSTATVTGNPQNIVIGNLSGISYLAFTSALAPVALIGLLICWCVIMVVYRREFQPTHVEVPDVIHVLVLWPTLWKSAVVVLAMLILFLAGVPVTLAALFAAAAMLTTRRLKPERVFARVDWGLLVFFAALFVVTGSLAAQGLEKQLFAVLTPIADRGFVPFALITVALSNLISNVPAVLLLQTIVPALPDPHRGWLMLAAAATLAGNLTLVGSVANLIVAEVAKRRNVHLTFGTYLRVGVPVTALTVAVALLLV
jgi:Na+/H+ antiporter NhaD/arsenite permease-like protein